MTKRQAALSGARVAGYHNDGAAFVRLIVENRVGRHAMNEAWRAGEAAKRAGVKCDCFQCKRNKGAA